MPFTKDLPEWNQPGVKPPQTKIDEGWKAIEKPPADWWNWFQYTAFNALKELQQNAVHKEDMAGTTEILVDWNNYRESGTYVAAAGLANAPTPSNTYLVQVISEHEVLTESTKSIQIAYGRINPNLMYIRRYNAGWSEWDSYSKGIAGGIATHDDLTSHKAEKASLTEVGHVQLSSATNSESELLAATPKAVKAAMDRAEAAFMSASNGKKDIASVIGLPATATDTFDQLKTHIQSSKNTLSMNLTSKGQTLTGTETLAELAAKVEEIDTGPGFEIAYGEMVVDLGLYQEKTVNITGLTFVPTHFFHTLSTYSYANGEINAHSSATTQGVFAISFLKISSTSFRVGIRRQSGSGSYLLKWWAIA